MWKHRVYEISVCHSAANKGSFNNFKLADEELRKSAALIFSEI